jgi:recombination protein RecA
MAKAKKEKIDVSISRKALIKKYGEVIINGTQLFELRKDLKTLGVSPAIDIALGGGLEEGSWVVISGDEKTGKSSTCLQIIANAQAEGRKVIYIDGEGRLKNCNLVSAHGLDLEKMDIIRCPPDDILSAEQFLDIAESIIKEPESMGAVCVLDSCSSLIPECELSKGVSGNNRNNLPRVLAHFTKKLAHVIPNQKVIFIMITHYVTNTSGFGKLKAPDCGKKIQYQADTKMDIKSSKPWVEGDQEIGKMIEWTIGCSSKGSTGKSAISYFRYNYGLDAIQELIHLCDDYGVIYKAGAWYTLSSLENHLEELGETEWDDAKYKFQGQAKLRVFLAENPKIVEIVRKDLDDFINGE